MWLTTESASRMEILERMGFHSESGFLERDGIPVRDVAGNGYIMETEVLAVLPPLRKNEYPGLITDVSQLEMSDADLKRIRRNNRVFRYHCRHPEAYIGYQYAYIRKHPERVRNSRKRYYQGHKELLNRHEKEKRHSVRQTIMNMSDEEFLEWAGFRKPQEVRF